MDLLRNLKQYMELHKTNRTQQQLLPCHSITNPTWYVPNSFFIHVFLKNLVTTIPLIVVAAHVDFCFLASYCVLVALLLVAAYVSFGMML